jgi:hypothetical protein
MLEKTHRRSDRNRPLFSNLLELFRRPVTERLASFGCYRVAVSHVGLSGAGDPPVWRYAYENDLIVVTQPSCRTLFFAIGGIVAAAVIVVIRTL